MKQIDEDYIIPKLPHALDVQTILYFMSYWWTDSFVSDINGHDLSLQSANPVRLFADREFVIYQNQAAKQDWDLEGYTSANSLTALLVMIEDDGLYLTYHPEAADFIGQLEQAIFANASLTSHSPRAVAA